MPLSNIYTRWEWNSLNNLKDDECVSRVAHIDKEVCKLVEACFDYVCGFNGNKIFRKRK